MSATETVLKLEKACVAAKEKLSKIKDGDYAALIEKIDYLVVSFNADGNPEGLYEVGAEALAELKAYKEKKPRQVSKALIEQVETALVK